MTLQKKKKARHWCRTSIQDVSQGKNLDAPNVLPYVHQLWPDWISIWTGYCKCLQRYTIHRIYSKEVHPNTCQKICRCQKGNNMQELERYFPEFQIIIDSSEQPIPIPQDKQKRKTHYSGKKKGYTIKNQYTINLAG
jgi:hypothetical protein